LDKTADAYELQSAEKPGSSSPRSLRPRPSPVDESDMGTDARSDTSIGVDDPINMARALAVLYLSGGLLVLLSLLLPHPQDANVVGLWTMVGIGFGAGIGGLIWARHARVWMVQAMLAFGTACISLCVLFSGVGAGIYSFMFVWVALVAGTFFSGRAVAAHVAWVILSWGLVLSQVEEMTGFSVLTRWALGSLVLIVTAAVLTSLMARRRSSEMALRDLQAEFQHLAHHDPLTGLPNRRLFESELAREFARAERQGVPLSVIALDLNDFKDYNDEHGHVAGDRLLKETAAAWLSVLREEDLIARFGGDEFLALLNDCPQTQADTVAQRLCAAVPLGQTCSTGVATWDRSEDAAGLLARADEALYASKARAAAAASPRQPLGDRPPSA
jgi:diguanylate cyclase (GGDEF)-like protein